MLIFGEIHYMFYILYSALVSALFAVGKKGEENKWHKHNVDVEMTPYVLRRYSAGIPSLARSSIYTIYFQATAKRARHKLPRGRAEKAWVV